TTRQNIQFNWIKLEDAADILDALSQVEMHAIQTSGNCIRNVTTDHWAGAAADELADPRPVAELVRQWSSLHPEFSYLPRKFKAEVEAEYARRPQASTEVEERELQRIATYFAAPSFEKLSRWSPAFEEARAKNPQFARWVRTNIAPHRVDGYAVVNISLKPEGGIPGDMSAAH